ncbi:anthranilate synthase subunit I [Oceanobacillus sp. E9]|uniref:anthranilate synthase component I n=1 Tax=Oceanobacillus sp. E9 TaxID=1742575 RepID=UPI00084E3D7A|nr:anthranilate synthase component I [Oceanobacillus sp. E9]OEH53626.1 anthranilate synthase subunit I [Oceanobacillus sp. E9]
MSIRYVIEKQPIDQLLPIQVLTQLDSPKKYLLESSFPHEEKGRFSFLGRSPYQEILGFDNRTKICNYKTHEDKWVEQHALHYIKQHLPKIEIDISFPFYGGAIGYISYDTIRSFEHIGDRLPDKRNMPDIHLMLFEDTIIFDHEEDTCYLLVIDTDSSASEHILQKRLEQLREIMKKARVTMLPFPARYSFTPEMDQETFESNVAIAKKYIEEGDIFQVVLSQRMQAKVENPETFSISFYEQLRQSNPSPYMFYMDFNDYLILGASPESLIETSGKKIITNPIAGTRKRGSTEEIDQMLTEELLSDEKERAEHQMLVDLSRNDLGRVCEIGSIDIPVYMKIEKYQHVMHMVSEVTGILKSNYSSIDALISCLPAGTVSGAPKIRAMQIINELEQNQRGPYGGGIGFINFQQDVHMALAIRTVIVKDDKAYLQAGAGIVYDSIPTNEYIETLNKAKSFMEVDDHDFINR